MPARAMLPPTSYVTEVRFLFLFQVLKHSVISLRRATLLYIEEGKTKGISPYKTKPLQNSCPHSKKQLHNITGLLKNQAAYTQFALIESKHDIFLSSVKSLPSSMRISFSLFLSPSSVNLTLILCIDCFAVVSLLVCRCVLYFCKSAEIHFYFNCTSNLHLWFIDRQETYFNITCSLALVKLKPASSQNPARYQLQKSKGLMVKSLNVKFRVNKKCRSEHAQLIYVKNLSNSQSKRNSNPLKPCPVWKAVKVFQLSGKEKACPCAETRGLQEKRWLLLQSNPNEMWCEVSWEA